MSTTGLNDRNANALSDLAYVADKLGKIDTTQAKNLGKVFFDDNGSIRDEIKADKDLYSFAQKIESNKTKYADVLDNTKLVGTANDTDTGYKGIALQDLRDKSVTIGNAGTEDGSDLINDLQMVEEFVNFGKTLTTEGSENTINGILDAKFKAA